MYRLSQISHPLGVGTPPGTRRSSDFTLFLRAILTTLVTLGFLSIASAAQQLLPNTAHLDEGISVSYPDGWSLGNPSQHSWVLLNVPGNELETAVPTVQVAIGYLRRTDHESALSQLTQYANESSTRSTFLTIDGWPALQRVQLVKRHQPGEGERPPFADPQMVNITTAVAVGNLLVRLEGSLPSNANQQLQNLVLAIGQSLTFNSSGGGPKIQQELKQLQTLPNAPKGDARLPDQAGPSAGAKKPAFMPDVSPPVFSPTLLNNGTNGELEVAVSNDGSNIVVVKQSGWITSNDGGQTFPFTGNLNVSDGDSSIAFGQSGNFYHAALSCFSSNCQPPCPGASPTGTPPSTNNCMAVAPSATKGQTFGALANAAICPNSGGSACSLDQEHIAADRINAGAGGKDRVYAAIRNCQGGCGTNGAFVTCSPDSNSTWAPLLALEKGSDFPRVGVGKDGSFYVVYEIGGNVRIDKFNACTTSAAQMTRASATFPMTVSGYTSFAGCEVKNGFGGLDRCNDGNTLSGPTVTIDDTNANHVYVAWANNTAANNENILVADSTNGGATWRTPVTVSAGVTARRYHPWACATGGNAFVSWYDRRAATAANNDLTDYFAASAGLSSGNLVANNDEFKISTTSDPQCKLWPAAPRSIWDSENCSVQPQNAGFCKVVPMRTPDPSTNNRCDYSGPLGLKCGLNPITNTQETCTTGNGAVKYGDYNGSACVLGRLYTVFASGAGMSSIGDFFQSFVVSSTKTTLTYTGATFGHDHQAVTLSAVLTLSGTPAGIGGQSISFSVGTQNCAGVTNSFGLALCSITLTQIPGLYTVAASFAGSGNYLASSTSTVFTIVAPPAIAKSFPGPTVPLNHSTGLTFSISNPNGTFALSGVGFTDILPAGLVISSPNGLTGSCGGGIITATAGSSSISLSDAVLGAAATCVFTVNVTGKIAGPQNNTTSIVTSIEGGNGGMASASITVVAPPKISKAFAAPAIVLGDSTALSFTIINPNATVALTDVGFTDNLPSGLIVATPNHLTGGCGGGSITAIAGSNSISLLGATLAASASCTFAVNVTGTTVGKQVNTTSAVNSLDGGSGNKASATITVLAPALTNYFSNANTSGAPDGTVQITNPGVSGGKLCADIFVFDANQELSECCSCIVAPDGLLTLSVNTDLTSNPLTGTILTTGVVEIIPAATAGGLCPVPTAMMPKQALRGWSTHIQEDGGFTVTEGKSQSTGISLEDLTALQAQCSYIQGGGSGHGICASSAALAAVCNN